MRSVAKGNGHYQLNQRNAAPPAISDEATAAWGNFRHKARTRDLCFAEQFGLCAYSEIRLDDNDLGMHLDHVEPKSVNPSRTFDHGNLLLSAIDDAKKRKLIRQDVFGGHYRQSRFSSIEFINPLWPDCRRYFHYASDGKIEPALGLSFSYASKARYTIEVLNLNAPILVNRRRRWLEELEDVIDDLIDDRVHFGLFAEAELCDTNACLQQFHSAARQRFGAFGERVIQASCRNCG
jgi:uncharacterized protein (TIGR02646 family)